MNYVDKFGVGDAFTIEGETISGWRKWRWRLSNMQWGPLPLQHYCVRSVSESLVVFEADT